MVKIRYMSQFLNWTETDRIKVKNGRQDQATFRDV